MNITKEQNTELQRLVDEFNKHAGSYSGQRYINLDVARDAAVAGRSVVKYLASVIGVVNDDAFTAAYKKAQDDEGENDAAAKEWE